MDSMHNWANTQRAEIGVSGGLSVKPYIKGEAAGGLLLNGGMEIKYDGSDLKISFKGGVNGQIGAKVSGTGGIEFSNGNLGPNSSQIGASGGSVGFGEGSFKTDGKYFELSIGGGAGYGAEVILIPIVNGSFEYEYTFSQWHLPLPKSRGYEGSPTFNEWKHMLEGNPWSEH